MKRLELTWIGKEERPRLEPRILLEDPELSYAKRVSNDDLFDNRLIHGDNLLALKALEQEFAGKVKCVFIDPPYNTGSAFSSYEDGLEHSIWLSLVRQRLECLHRLLAADGTLWVTLDDNEAHYFKVLCDEVFGRRNFLGTIIWEKSDSPRMDAEFFSFRHDYIIVYARDRDAAALNRLPVAELPPHYNKVDEKGQPYYLKPLRAMGGDDRREDRPTMYFPLSAPDGTNCWPKRQDGSDGRWRWGPDRVVKDVALVEWVRGREGWSPYYRVYASVELTSRPVETIWRHEEVGSNRTSKAEIKALFGEKAFDTPKPEALVARVLQVATMPGDIVLDSFLGSGTTAAVAHKMKRRWLGIEVLEHARALVVPRLTKVIDGVDGGGATQSVGWKGGGGFRFFTLATSLLEKDKWGNWIVSKQYKPEMLAEAMCKLEGFRYAPDREVFWNHGHSTERDFIYVTTQNLSLDQLRFISDQVGPERTLLICCGAFRGKPDYPNVTVKKIPQAVLARCEWGRDDYSLNVTEQAPVVAVEEAKAEGSVSGTKAKSGVRRKKPAPMQTLPLFAGITGSSSDQGGSKR